jgi:hypothetical protein
MEVGSDGLVALSDLTEVVVEVDGFASLVCGEELECGEQDQMRRLIPGEDHVGDILVDGGVEDVEDSVVAGRPLGVVGAAMMVPSM